MGIPLTAAHCLKSRGKDLSPNKVVGYIEADRKACFISYKDKINYMSIIEPLYFDLTRLHSEMFHSIKRSHLILFNENCYSAEFELNVLSTIQIILNQTKNILGTILPCWRPLMSFIIVIVLQRQRVCHKLQEQWVKLNKS